MLQIHKFMLQMQNIILMMQKIMLQMQKIMLIMQKHMLIQHIFVINWPIQYNLELILIILNQIAQEEIGGYN